MDLDHFFAEFDRYSGFKNSYKEILLAKFSKFLPKNQEKLC